jgi:phosphomannomutase
VLNQENLSELQQVVAHSQENLGVGLAIDGDGCHMQAVDKSGTLISHDQMFGLLLDYLVREKEWEGGIVKPNRQNDFAEQVAALHGLTITYSATTDFRNITSEMVHELAIMASDGLGGYAFQGHIMERDGILASLLVLEMIAARKKNLNQLIADLSAELSAA